MGIENNHYINSMIIKHNEWKFHGSSVDSIIKSMERMTDLLLATNGLVHHDPAKINTITGFKHGGSLFLHREAMLNKAMNLYNSRVTSRLSVDDPQIDNIDQFRGDNPVIAVAGAPGSGKSTALDALATIPQWTDEELQPYLRSMVNPNSDLLAILHDCVSVVISFNGVSSYIDRSFNLDFNSMIAWHIIFSCWCTRLSFPFAASIPLKASQIS